MWPQTPPSSRAAMEQWGRMRPTPWQGRCLVSLPEPRAAPAPPAQGLALKQRIKVSPNPLGGDYQRCRAHGQIQTWPRTGCPSSSAGPVAF